MRRECLTECHEALTPYPLYASLGKTNARRQEAYRALFKTHVDAKDLKDIRAAWQTGTPLGNDYFKDKIERKLKCKVGQARRGRPAKRALTLMSLFRVVLRKRKAKRSRS